MTYPPASAPAVDPDALFAASPAAMLVLAPDGPRFTITDVNDAYLVAVMRRREDLVGRPLFEAMPDNPADPAASGVANLRASIERAIASGQPDRMPVQKYDIPHPDGGFEERWWEPVNAPVLDARGEVVAIVHHVVDATQRERAEAAQRGSEEVLRSVLASVDGIVFAKGLDGRYLVMNDAGTRVHGKTAAETIGRTDVELFGPETGAVLQANDAAALAAGAPLIVEERATVDGVELTYQTTKSPFRDASGAVAGVVGVSIDVTERKAAEAALARSEAQFRLTADAVPQIVWITDADGRTEFFNKQWTDYTGVPYEPTTAADVAANHVHPEDAEATLAAFDEARRAGRTFLIEHRIRSKTGDYRWFLVRGEPYRDPQSGEVVRWFGASTDIHDRRLAEAALRASEARLRFLDRLGAETASLADADAVLATTTRLLGEHLGLSVCAYADMDEDENGFTIRGDWAAPGSRNIVGHYSLADFGRLAVENLSAGRPLVINDNLRELAPEEAATFQNIGIAATICMPLVKDGRLTALMAIHDRTPRSWTDAELGLLREVTARSWAHIERVGAAAELRASEERYRMLFEAIESGFCVAEVDLGSRGGRVDYRVVEANPAFYRQTGFDPRILGRWLRDATPTLEEHWYETYGRVAATGTPERFEQGSELLGRWFDVYAFRVGKPEERRIAILFNDISARRNAEIALRRLNDTLEAQVAARAAERDRLWNLSQDMLARADYSGMMSAVSPAWTQILGWSGAELLSRGYATFMHPEDLPETLRSIERMSENRRPARFQNRIATRDGGWKHVEWTVAPEPDGLNFIAVGRDLSSAKAREAELDAAQEALRQSQKLEAMGQLTGGVSHDFNNLLSPIMSSLDLLQRKGVGGEREQRLIDGALQSAERAKTLVQRLLAFARRQPLQARPVDVGALVEGMADLVASTSGPRIEVSVDIAEGLPAAVADPNQVEMAILNLSVNARDAMPDGGKLTISARADDVGMQHRAGLPAGRYVRLSVADTGLGMDAETVRRAVEPFFSTKGVGRGTGLGLSMVHGLAAQLGGAMAIDSRPGLGTNVEVWLPASTTGAAAPQAASDDAASPRAGTALLVEDEELVRASTADMLTELGYAVVEASSGEEALRLIDDGLSFDILISDHLMPGMTGSELARRVRSRRPSLPVLLVSGYAEVEGVAADLPRLVKPFRRSDLTASLAALSDGSS